MGGVGLGVELGVGLVRVGVIWERGSLKVCGCRRRPATGPLRELPSNILRGILYIYI